MIRGGAKVGEERDFPKAGDPPGDGLRLGSFRVAMEARENRGLPAKGWVETRVVSNQDWQFSLMPRRYQCSGVSKGKGRGMARGSRRAGIPPSTA